MKAPEQYFAEIEPLIYQRLKKTTRILWIAGVIVFIASLTRCFSLYTSEGMESARLTHQIISSALFFPYILTMICAELVIKSNTRLGVQITLLATFCMLSSQLILNGDRADHAIMAIPVLMTLAGFVANNRVTILVTTSVIILITALTSAEYMGVVAYNPDSNGYLVVIYMR